MKHLLLVWVLFVVGFWEPSFAANADGGAEELFKSNAECCGSALSLVSEIDLDKKSLKVKKAFRLSERICRPRNPMVFGNSVLALFDKNGKLVLKLKEQIPTFTFTDQVLGDGKLTGSVEPVRKTIVSLKIPQCVSTAGLRAKIYRLSGELLVEGSL